MNLKSILLVILVMPLFSYGQESEVSIGDTLYFTECHGESFKYMDYYIKTRTEDSTDYTQLEEWDFYNTFFTQGDFDVSRMPCSMQDSFAVIKFIFRVEDSDQNWHNVVIALFPDAKSAAYVLEDAFVHEEVLLAPTE